MAAGSEAGRPRWFVEAPLLVAGYVLFGLVRRGVGRGDPLATDNALVVQRTERFLRVAVEYPLNHALAGHTITVYVSGAYYRLCLLAVPAVLIWLWIRHPERYSVLRTVLVVLTLADLPLVLLFPESPPRFAQAGIVDFVADRNILGGATLRDPHAGLNLLAAMPSMHVAWTAWCAWAVFGTLKARFPRAAWSAWLFPAFTAFDVLATGNHYVLDVVTAAALLALVVWACSEVRARSRISAQSSTGTG